MFDDWKINLENQCGALQVYSMSFFAQENHHRRNPERHGCRNRRAGRETVQGAAGQAGHDVRVADREGEVGVTDPSLRWLSRCRIKCAS